MDDRYDGGLLSWEGEKGLSDGPVDRALLGLVAEGRQDGTIVGGIPNRTGDDGLHGDGETDSAKLGFLEGT